MKRPWKIFVSITFILLAVVLFFFQKIGYKPAVCETREVNLYPKDNIDSLISYLSEDECFQPFYFIWASKIIGLDLSLPSGKYSITPGLSALQIARKIKSQKQKPVMVVVQNGRTLEDLCQQLSKQLMTDSTTICAEFVNKLSEEGYLSFSKENLLTLIIPNSYEMYWNISSRTIVNRLIAEQSIYWEHSNRREKIAHAGITETQAYILASIVEKESIDPNERAIIAGLYLNRLNLGMPLQADPTVVFANGDFTLRRVLKKHLTLDSPYNTYLYAGLPPGPICMPSLNSLESVINAEKHDFLYMCALPGYEGKHAFSKTYSEHTINALKYRKWLNQQGIK